ncbi:MAG: biotin transporter BioY [Bacilli bacterium]|nr:biotin transporter BioY [Bacilli bacterium]
MRETNWTRRIAKDGVLLALLCVIGMFSIPLADNVKVSLQLYAVLVLCFLVDGFLDALLITGCYLLMGLFLPIYAGFGAGITPTFGYVIGFVLASPVLYFLNRLPIHKIPRLILASLAGTLIIYVSGTIFMMLYLNWDLPKTLLVSIVPYLPFDAVKIALAILTYLAMPSFIVAEPVRKKDNSDP